MTRDCEENVRFGVFVCNEDFLLVIFSALDDTSSSEVSDNSFFNPSNDNNRQIDKLVRPVVCKVGSQIWVCFGVWVCVCVSEKDDENDEEGNLYERKRVLTTCNYTKWSYFSDASVLRHHPFRTSNRHHPNHHHHHRPYQLFSPLQQPLPQPPPSPPTPH